MKKIVPVLMVMVMALSFAGCGKKDGFGATKKTYFFDYTVNSAYVCSEFEGYQPAQGNELLVASRTGLLVFEVPAGNKEFSISYMEAFDDDSTGDTYFVNFTAEAK